MSRSSNTTRSDPSAFLESAAKALLSGNKELNLGPIMMGFSIDLILFGVMMHQVVTFLSYSRNEKTLVKITLTLVVSLSTALTVFSMFVIWGFFIDGFGTYSHFIRLDLISWFGILDIVGVVCIQIFYVDRAYRLHHESKWVLLILPLIANTLAGGITTKVKIAQLPSVLEVTLSSTLVTDLVLTVTMAWALWRSRTGWSDTDRLINRLIRITVETQLPGTLCAFGSLVNTLVDPLSLFNYLWFFLAKSYTVPFLAVINYKIVLRKDLSSGSATASSTTAGDGIIGQDSSGHRDLRAVPTIPLDADGGESPPAVG